MKERRTNFFMVDNRIFEYDLKPRDIAVYCFLCRRLNQESNVAFPSRKDIAKGCGIKKEETVDKALKVLVEKGLIEKYHRHTNAGDYGSNVYRLNLESGGIKNGGSNKKTSTILYSRKNILYIL